MAIARKLLLAAWRVWREGRYAHEMNRRRYQHKLSAIRHTLRTLPPYPLAQRWSHWTDPALSGPSPQANSA